MTACAQLIRDVRRRAGLTQAELARRAGTSQAAVARYESGEISPVVSTLERLLTAAGYRLDLAAASPPPSLEDVRGHREEIVAMAEAKGATNVRVFGSVARGEAGTASDIDLLVDFDPVHGLIPLMELADELEQLLGHRVDVAPAHLLTGSAAQTALKDAVTL